MEFLLLALAGVAAGTLLVEAFSRDDPDSAGEDGEQSRQVDGQPAAAGSEPDLMVGTDEDDTLHAPDGAKGTVDLYGLDGDDLLTMGANSGSAAYGGSGDDRIAAQDSGSAHGGAGDDQIGLRDEAQGDGGAGNDLIAIQPGADDAAPMQASGGTGADVFALLPPQGSAAEPVLITDFDPDEDRLVIDTRDDATASVLQGVEVATDPDGAFVELTVTWASDTDPTAEPVTAVIRLMGIAEFDPEAIEFVKDVWSFSGPSDDGVVITPSAPQPPGDDGTGNDDTDSRTDDTTEADSDQADTDIGTGTAVVGQAAATPGGATVATAPPQAANPVTSPASSAAATPPLPALPPPPFYFGTEGDDTLAVSVLPHNGPVGAAWGLVYLYGGAGDDVMMTGPASGTGIELYGGAGDDSLHIHSGQTAYGGGGSDAITVDVTADAATLPAAVVADVSATSEVVVNIPADLTGEIRFVDLLAENGTEVTATEVYVGDTLVLILKDSGEDLSAEDPRLTFARDEAA